MVVGSRGGRGKGNWGGKEKGNWGGKEKRNWGEEKEAASNNPFVLLSIHTIFNMYISIQTKPKPIKSHLKPPNNPTRNLVFKKKIKKKIQKHKESIKPSTPLHKKTPCAIHTNIYV